MSGAPLKADEVVLEAFGVRFVIAASHPGLLARLASLAPPGSRPASGEAPGEWFALVADDGGVYRVLQGEAEALACRDRELALEMLAGLVCEHVAFHAPRRTFIKGEAVVHRGRAIVVVGPPVSGKTTLVWELVSADWSCWSDHYVILDEGGQVRPYRESTAAGHDREDSAHPPASATIETVVVTHYRPGARWRPLRGTAGDAALALLAHAVPARKRPAEVLAVVRRAAANATVLEGERGEAVEVARALLEDGSVTPAALHTSR